jgi:hypothetical protein
LTHDDTLTGMFKRTGSRIRLQHRLARLLELQEQRIALAASTTQFRKRAAPTPTARHVRQRIAIDSTRRSGGKISNSRPGTLPLGRCSASFPAWKSAVADQ